MSYSGDAAEQVVRLSLESGEVAVKLAGAGAKQLAILLYAVLREQKKTKGKIRLTNMLRSGKELKVFAVKDVDLQLFCREAKKYGILYCVLKDRDATDGITDVMVRAEDASKINRIFERFNLATVDMASVKNEIERGYAEGRDGEVPTERQQMSEQETEDLLDELLQPAPAPEESQGQGPFTDPPQAQEPLRGDAEQTREANMAAEENGSGKSHPSEPISKPKEPTTPDISEPEERSRPSVRQELNDITAEQREKAARGKEQPKPTKGPKHKAPRKYKPKRLKER